MNNIVLLAAYWNEIEWIRPSLDQIARIDPVEVIISDGCFDPMVEALSTDGTREEIEKFVAERPNASLIAPVRAGRAGSPWAVARSFDWRLRSLPADIYVALEHFRVVAYRRNQALTFNRMRSMSKHWKPGAWFMSYDCDQFYPDAMLAAFRDVVNDLATPFDVLVADEFTFFDSFTSYTTDHAAARDSNMPHRVYEDSIYRPTRIPCRRSFRGPVSYLASGAPLDLGGHYFHYKNRGERYRQSYTVGDRQAPDASSYAFQEYVGEHPPPIANHFGV